MFNRYNDPPYVKMKKVELLTELCNADNAESIVNELGYVTAMLLYVLTIWH